MDNKIQELENIITLQKNEIEQLKERLSKYTNPNRNKVIKFIVYLSVKDAVT